MTVSPKCPTSSSDATQLSRFLACTASFQLGMSSAQIDAYFASGQDYACLSGNGGCSAARQYNACPTPLVDVVGSVVSPALQAAFGQSSALATCQTMFTTHLSSYCTQPVSAIINHYCPPVPLFTTEQLAGIIVGGAVVLVFLLWMVVRLKHSWALEREIQNALLDIPQDALLRPPPGLGPARAANQALVNIPGGPPPRVGSFTPGAVMREESNRIYVPGGPPPRVGSFSPIMAPPPASSERTSRSPFIQPATGMAPPNFVPGSPPVPMDARRAPSQTAQLGGPPSPSSPYRGVRPNARNPRMWDAFVFVDLRGVEEVIGTFGSAEEAAVAYDARVMQLREAGATTATLNFAMQAPSPAFAGAVPAIPVAPIAAGVDGPAPHAPHAPHAAPHIVIPALVHLPEDPETRARHEMELVKFYEYYNLDQPNLEEHVKQLFDKYSFLGISRALRAKYGVLPAGWEEEATRAASHNFSTRLSRMVFGSSTASYRQSTTAAQRKPKPGQSASVRQHFDVGPQF